MARYYPAIIEPASEGYGVFFPDVPGCTSAGVTVQEAARNAEEALQAHLGLAAERGEAIPPPPRSSTRLHVMPLWWKPLGCWYERKFPDARSASISPCRRSCWRPWTAMRRGAAIRGRDYWRRRCGNG
jgi:predicted RNase H-like HicB family nuclease